MVVTLSGDRHVEIRLRPSEASNDEQTEAFASYERIVRPFVVANQALATKAGGSLPCLGPNRSWTHAIGP